MAVRVRTQPYRVDGEWSGLQAQNIDEMIQILFDDLKLLANAVIGSEGEGGIYELQDDDLDALAALTTTGILVRTGDGTATTRSIAGGSNISVADGTGVSGNPTVSLTGIGTTIEAWDADLDAVAGLSGTGLIARTGTGTATTRTITAGTGISVSDGGGVAGNPTITATSTPAVTTGPLSLGVLQSTRSQGWYLYDANNHLKQSPEFNGIGATVEAWDADLDALAALSSTGIAVRTAANTWAQRTLQAGTGISISQGDGVAGDPTISATATGTVSNAQVAEYTSGGVLWGNGVGWEVFDSNGALKTSTSSSSALSAAQVAANVSLRVL